MTRRFFPFASPSLSLKVIPTAERPGPRTTDSRELKECEASSRDQPAETRVNHWILNSLPIATDMATDLEIDALVNNFLSTRVV